MEREEKSELKRKIFFAAYQLFLKQGYENTTTREIAAKAGIERGHLYYYYKRKEDFLYEWYNQLYNGLYELMLKQYTKEKNADVLITAMAFIYYRLIFSDEAITELIISILKNRQLTRIKVEKTTELYCRVLSQNLVGFSKQEIMTKVVMVIGAETELLLDCFDSFIDMNMEECVNRILKLQLHLFGNSSKKTENIMCKAQEYAEKFNFLTLDQIIYYEN